MKKYEIEDWEKLTSRIIREENGAGLLLRYKGSIFKMLSAIFKGILHSNIGVNEIVEKNWDKQMWIDRRKGYWKLKQNQRNFLEKVALKFNVKNEQDWHRIGTRDIIAEGGAALLARYGNSLMRSLKSVFPGSI